MLPDWLELCALFAAHGVDYLVVGGQAVIAHGYPRLTKDLDLWVAPTAANGERVLAALREFGTPLAEFSATRFEDAETMLSLGADPFRIDILTSLPALVFAEAWPRRSTVTIEGTPLPLIGKADLIANKKAVGRLQDLADAEALEAIDH